MKWRTYGAAGITNGEVSFKWIGDTSRNRAGAREAKAVCEKIVQTMNRLSTNGAVFDHDVFFERIRERMAAEKAARAQRRKAGRK